MLPAEVLRQVRRLQIRARRAVTSRLAGAYHSAFHGSGLEFEDVREYQPGDDIRAIDRNVTARTGRPFVKRFVEERELTVLLVTDLSASQGFGTARLTKRAVTAELAALLAFAAVGNNDRVGLVGFTDTVERHVPPGKGGRHALRVLRDILFFEPTGRGTDIRAVLDTVARTVRRRAVVVLVSDFLGRGYEDRFRRVARQHDLIAVRVADPREEVWPAVGLVQLEDAETGRQRLVDTSSRAFQDGFARQAVERREAFRKLARSAGADLIETSTVGDHVDELVKFFRTRERRRRRR